MKRRILTGGLLLLLLGCLCMPFFSVYAHMGLSEEIAQALPGDVTGIQLILRGNAFLPLTRMPALAALSFREGLLLAGVILAAVGAVFGMFRRGAAARLAVLLGGAGLLPLLLFAFYGQQLDQSLLFSVMLTVKWQIWLPFILSAGLFAMALLRLRSLPTLAISDRGWRLLSAVLCAVTLLMFVFPFAGSTISSGVFADPQEDALASRTVSGWEWMVSREPLLEELGSEAGLFTAPVDGGLMRDLVTLSDSSSGVKNLFRIPTHNGTVRSLAIAAVVLLAAGLVLQLLRKVDRWIPASLITVAALLLIAEVMGMLSVDSSYQFRGAAYQMIYLGLGGYTLFPLFLCMAAAGASACAVLGIRRADTPYFVNPIPQRKRLLVISLTLAIGAAALLCVPICKSTCIHW